ncbi:MAG: siderophore-interacting protein [Hyphomicrobiales bacterium]|nr:MAG: siderophore-interacting protein [Hyphomicrobiales bacterium]
MTITVPATTRMRIALRKLSVVAIRDITPALRRITLGGAELGAFRANGHDIEALRTGGPDDHIKLFFPDPVTGVLSLPVQRENHIDWPRNPAPISRDYTPRAFDPAAGTLDLEFVLHGHGIASTWAAGVSLGDTAYVAGPPTTDGLPVCPRYVLIGDETALPAIGNWLALLKDHDVTLTALLYSRTADGEQPLPAPPGASITWLRQDTSRPEAMAEALAEIDLPEGTFVWAGGEREAMRAIRRQLAARGVPRPMTSVVAYWRAGLDQDQFEDEEEHEHDHDHDDHDHDHDH